MEGNSVAALADALRSQAHASLDAWSPDAAAFFADKLVALTSSPSDALLLARSLRAAGDGRRALRALEARGLVQHSPEHALLAAKCLASWGDWDKCSETLAKFLDSRPPTSALPRDTTLAALWCLRGKASVALEKRATATTYLLRALEVDPLCYEALAALRSDHLLSPVAELKLLEGLRKAIPEQFDLVYDIYASQCPRSAESQEALERVSANPLLAQNGAVLAARALRAYEKRNYRESLAISSKAVSSGGADPSNTALFVYLSSMVELKIKSELSFMANKIAEERPQDPLSWYAVGCFFFTTQNWSESRKHFFKATSLDPLFGYAWLAIGHTFAKQGEHDQAISAYHRASRLLDDSHVPFLSLGMESEKNGDIEFALQYITRADTICGTDPLVKSELGLLAFHKEEYVRALNLFGAAADLARDMPAEILEPILVNLGHANRKLLFFDEAIKVYRQALMLRPNCGATHVALGFTLELKGDIDGAIGEYHKCLALQQDAQAATLLDQALKLKSSLPI
eukprot:m51a1_g9043 hypothetical protein (516) ;mRNA; f:7061-9358